MDLWLEDLHSREDFSCFVTEYLQVKKASKFDETVYSPQIYSSIFQLLLRILLPLGTN